MCIYKLIWICYIWVTALNFLMPSHVYDRTTCNTSRFIGYDLGMYIRKKKRPVHVLKCSWAKQISEGDTLSWHKQKIGQSRQKKPEKQIKMIKIQAWHIIRLDRSIKKTLLDRLIGWGGNQSNIGKISHKIFSIISWIFSIMWKFPIKIEPKRISTTSSINPYCSFVIHNPIIMFYKTKLNYWMLNSHRLINIREHDQL